MTAFCYIFLFTVLTTILELLLRSFGLFLPLVAVFVFYASVVFGVRNGFVLALFGGMGLDFVLGYSFPLTSVSLCLVVVLALLWLYRVESDSLALHAAPGAIIPLIVYLPLLFFYCGVAEFLYFATDILISCLLVAGMLPFSILFLDILNEKLGLDLYLNAKMKRELRR